MNRRRDVLESGMHECLGAAGLAMLAAGAGTAAARGVVESDFEAKNAQDTNPQITAETMGWATKILVV